MKNQTKFKLGLLTTMAMVLLFTYSCKDDDEVVAKQDAVITWSNPADITVGTALSNNQLNATANVPGTFSYNPASGTTMSLGLNQNLSVTFTPNDINAYNPVSKNVVINVVAATNAATIEMVNIPAGTFTMGSPSTEYFRGADEALHSVTLSAFKMSKREITVAQFAAFLNAKSIGSNGIWAAAPVYKTQVLVYESAYMKYVNNQWTAIGNYANNPVVHVTWYGAAEFATYAGGTLPTEAQWEYACRANTTTPFNTGALFSYLEGNYSWKYPYDGGTNAVTNSPRETVAVGSYVANAFGLFDMHGNAWEWCSDWYADYGTGAQANPAGALTGTSRVARGGCYFSHAHLCRSANRSGIQKPTFSMNDLGFRIVMMP